MTKNNRAQMRSAATLAVVIGMLISGCSKSETNTPGENEIWIEGSAFNPVDMVIALGTTVTWTNKDGYVHTVTSGTPGAPSILFDSGDLDKNATYSFTFDIIGTFSYYCNIHSGMTGSITVQ